MLIKKPTHELVPDGLHDAYVEAVNDLGLCKTNYGEKDLLEVVFVTRHKNSRDELSVLKKRFTKSLARKSNLLSLVTVLLDGQVPDALNPDDLVGRECLLVVANQPDKAGKIWSNITSVLPPRSSQPPAPPARGFLFDPRKPGQDFTLPPVEVQ